VFPDATRSLLVVPSSTPLDPYFAERLNLSSVERVHLRPDDVDPYFDVFEWDQDVALTLFLTPQSGAVTAGSKSVGLPVSFGGVVELLAYESLTPTVEPSGTVELVTLWRILGPDELGPVLPRDYGHAVVIFAHVLDAADAIVGQEDRLDTPAWDWRSGDAFVQLHRFRIDADAPLGLYRLEVGIYIRADLARLPVIVDDVEVDDRVLLSPVEVVGQ
jgi:hypothetical protein